MRFGIDVGAKEPRVLPSTPHFVDLLQQLPHPFLEAMLHAPRTLHHLDELLNSSPRSLDAVELGEGVEPVRDVGHEGALIGLSDVADVLDIEESGDADLFGRDAEGESCVAFVV